MISLQDPIPSDSAARSCTKNVLAPCFIGEGQQDLKANRSYADKFSLCSLEARSPMGLFAPMLAIFLISVQRGHSGDRILVQVTASGTHTSLLQNTPCHPLDLPQIVPACPFSAHNMPQIACFLRLVQPSIHSSGSWMVLPPPRPFPSPVQTEWWWAPHGIAAHFATVIVTNGP